MLRILAQALRDFDAQLFAFCLMGNHYHLVLQTRQANLSVVMHRVNTSHCRSFNQRHGRHGHVFEGRFKAVLWIATATCCRRADMSISTRFVRGWSSRLASDDGRAIVRVSD